MIEYIEISELDYLKLRNSVKSEADIKGNYCYTLGSGYIKIYRVHRIKT